MVAGIVNNELKGVGLLSEEEDRELAAFSEKHRSSADVGKLAAFFSEKLRIELTTDLDVVAGFVQDESHLPGEAFGVCRPKTKRDVAAAMRAAHLCGVPVTVCSGRSNLTGSATPEGGMMLSMLSLAEPVFSVDEEAKLVTAPVGMILEDMRKEVLAATRGRLCFPVDPTSRAEATVGGAIACNASGFTPGAPGAMRDWVERVEVVLPCGTLVSARRGEVISGADGFVVSSDGEKLVLPVPRHARPRIKNAGGPFSAEDGIMDFVDFIVGSEGIYGVVVGVELRLAKPAEAYLDLFFSLPSEAEAVRFRMDLEEALGGSLSGLTACEYFGENCRKHMDHETLFFKGADPVAIYLQVPSATGEADALAEKWFERLCDLDLDPDSIIMLDNDRDRALFMEARHSMPANSIEEVTRRGAFTVMTDTVVPKERFGEFMEYANGLLKERGIDYLAFGHIGDCHIHFSMMPRREQLDDALDVYDSIVAKSAAMGGIYSGEHGTGKRKRADFEACHGRTGIDAVRKTKAALDPEFLLNRGNVVMPA